MEDMNQYENDLGIFFITKKLFSEFIAGR